MTRPEDDRTMVDVLQLLTTEGFGGMGEAARCLINLAMKLERQQYLGVNPYERGEERQGSAKIGRASCRERV